MCMSNRDLDPRAFIWVQWKQQCPSHRAGHTQRHLCVHIFFSCFLFYFMLNGARKQTYKQNILGFHIHLLHETTFSSFNFFNFGLNAMLTASTETIQDHVSECRVRHTASHAIPSELIGMCFGQIGSSCSSYLNFYKKRMKKRKIILLYCVWFMFTVFRSKMTAACTV